MISLSGQIITTETVEIIRDNCPELRHLAMNFSSFEGNEVQQYDEGLEGERGEAFHLFATEICPRLLHLSVDNLFIRRFQSAAIFHFANKLIDAEVQIIWLYTYKDYFNSILSTFFISDNTISKRTYFIGICTVF